MAASDPVAWLAASRADPRPWLLDCDEAPARWIALAELCGAPAEEVAQARRAAIASPMVSELVERLPGWGGDHVVSGHHSPAYLPNMLSFLADLGLQGGDDERVEGALDALMAHQRDDGRFPSYGTAPGHPEPMWAALPCDTHIITEVLIRYGRGKDPAVMRAVQRIIADLQATTQGPGWGCIPDPVAGWRGPGRKGDVCPQATLEALRVLSRLPQHDRPEGLEQAAGTVLEVWRNRSRQHPYMFGHGVRFKTVKWPPLWYGVYWVADTLGRYPSLWQDPASPHRAAVAELVACLVAYNMAADGTVTPGSIYRGFSGYSFGQKKRPSPVATALVTAVVSRFGDLAAEAAGIDVMWLDSSRQDAASPVPPKVTAR